MTEPGRREADQDLAGAGSRELELLELDGLAQLFALQDAAYRERVASLADRWDAMVISNRSRRVTQDWIAHPIVAEYSLTSDWDDRWRTGGSVEEVIDEAHLSPQHILAGIERFAGERDKRVAALRGVVDAIGA